MLHNWKFVCNTFKKLLERHVLVNVQYDDGFRDAIGQIELFSAVRRSASNLLIAITNAVQPSVGAQQQCPRDSNSSNKRYITTILRK